MAYEMKELEGTLWVEDAKVLGKGKIRVNNHDQHYAIIESKTRDGSKMYEVMVSLGLVYFNAPEDKKSEKSPDISGTISVAGQKMRASFWNNTSQAGKEYISAKLKPAEDADIPF